MSKLKVKVAWIYVVGILTAVGAFVLAWTLGLGETLRKREKEKASKELAADLKAKVEEIKAERAEEKAAVELAVAKIEADAEKAKAADSVDVANALIADVTK
jgi:SepF-like predicted cell division protein (DUF552 family)